MTFGEKLQKLRARAGLSQDQLAELLDVSRQAVSKWERDEAMPEAEKIVRISRQFGVSTDYLLLEEQGDLGIPADPQLWDRLKTRYRESGYLLGWIPVAWGAWGLFKSVWNTLITLPVLGGWGVLQFFFTGLLTAHVQNLLKILFGALLVLALWLLSFNKLMLSASGGDPWLGVWWCWVCSAFPGSPLSELAWFHFPLQFYRLAH